MAATPPTDKEILSTVVKPLKEGNGILVTIKIEITIVSKDRTNSDPKSQFQLGDWLTTQNEASITAAAGAGKPSKYKPVGAIAKRTRRNQPQIAKKAAINRVVSKLNPRISIVLSNFWDFISK